MQSPQITPSLPLGQAPHAVRRPPCRAAASRFHIPVFHATFVPHAIPRPPHAWAASPYGIAVSPYSHTPDAFPHTFSADPPYNPQAPKNPTPNPERPATGPANQASAGLHKFPAFRLAQHHVCGDIGTHSRRDQRGGQMGLHRQVRLQAQQRTPPTTRQALLTYSHAKCLSSRLTVMSRRRRHGVQSSAQGGGLPSVCGLA